MRDLVDKTLEGYFPKRWESEHIDALFGASRFERDTEALDEGLNRPVRDFLLRGGKRMRPTLLLSLLQGFGKDPKDYLDFAVFIELVHNGTLVVDDVEDSSELRRGKPTLHKQFGVDVAVNAGVAMHVLPLQMLVKDHPAITDEMRLKLYQIYSQEIVNVYAGQTLDIQWHKHVPDTVTRDQYLEMARLKTGGLTRMAVRFASVLAEQDTTVETQLSQYAESAGIAFQIRDDVLDLTADQATFGKAFGNDISEGKISLPIVLTLQQLTDDDKQQLQDILREHSRDKATIERARALVNQTTAIPDAMEYAHALISEAWETVKQMIPSGEGRDALERLTASFTTRDH